MNKNDQDFLVQKIRTQYTEKKNTELDELKEKVKAYAIQDEDVLSYALFDQVATKYFEWRRAQELGIDLQNGDKALGVHSI